MQEGDIGDMNYYWRQRLMEQFLQMEKMRENKDKYYVTRGRLEGKIERLKRQHELLAYRGQFPQACNQC